MITKMVLSCCDKKWIVKESDNRKMLMGDTEIDIPASWHLISKACTISIPKNGDETFEQFQERFEKCEENKPHGN